jgi:hypothetical protein
VCHEDPGVVHEDVNAAQGCRRVIDHHPDRVSIPQIRLCHNVARSGQ